jgi:hypothetical protein
LPRKGYTDWSELPYGDLAPYMFCNLVSRANDKAQLRKLWSNLHTENSRLEVWEVQSFEDILLKRAYDLGIALKGEK